MKIYQLKELTKEELLQKRFELEDELFNFRLTAQVKKLDNPLKLRTIRKDIARICTLVRQMELQAGSQKTGPEKVKK